jgi:hypothetical protein
MAIDSCGDGWCGLDEDYLNCPVDCPINETNYGMQYMTNVFKRGGGGGGGGEGEGEGVGMGGGKGVLLT